MNAGLNAIYVIWLREMKKYVRNKSRLLGSRAGRERYEQVSRQARLVWDRPEVQSVAGIVSAQASGLYRRVRTVVGGQGTPAGGSVTRA